MKSAILVISSFGSQTTHRLQLDGATALEIGMMLAQMELAKMQLINQYSKLTKHEEYHGK